MIVGVHAYRVQASVGFAGGGSLLGAVADNKVYDVAVHALIHSSGCPSCYRDAVHVQVSKLPCAVCGSGKGGALTGKAALHEAIPHPLRGNKEHNKRRKRFAEVVRRDNKRLLQRIHVTPVVACDVQLLVCSKEAAG